MATIKKDDLNNNFDSHNLHKKTQAKKPINLLLPTTLLFLISQGLFSNFTMAQEVSNTSVETVNDLEQIRQYSQDLTRRRRQKKSQVTSVSQLSDVQPTDWAFQALQSLVERYGCIAGYPDGTYKGNRALTRYEFAAGVNACLERVNELISASTANLLTREDLLILQRLQEEFAAEIASLRGRVTALEARTAELESNQFSTTTKLLGEVVFSLQSGLNDVENEAPQTTFRDNPTFNHRTRLIFDTSFSGEDRLRVRIEARNINQGVSGGRGMATLNYAGNNNSGFTISDINYRFPVGDKFNFLIGVKDTAIDDYIQIQNPLFASSATGALTFFSAYNFLVYPTSRGKQLIAGRYQFSDFASFEMGYYSRNGADATSQNGLFNGTFGLTTQLNIGDNQDWGVSFTYTHTYDPAKDVLLTEGIGSPLSNRPFGRNATTAERFGITAYWDITSQFQLGGWGAYALAEAKEGFSEGDNADIWSWAATMAFQDLLKEGDVVGLIFGMPPKLTDSETGLEDKDTSLLLEAHYRFPLSDHITITPGFFVVFDPDHDASNDDVWAGLVRTSFRF
ncbi:MAG: iron uptake porin [Microcoleaceae cyanobacterium]